MAGLVGVAQRKESIDLDSQINNEQQQIFDLENEDNLEVAEQLFDDINEYFLKVFHQDSKSDGLLQTVELGLIEIEFSDSMIRKAIEVMFNGWP